MSLILANDISIMVYWISHDYIPRVNTISVAHEPELHELIQV